MLGSRLFNIIPVTTYASMYALAVSLHLDPCGLWRRFTNIAAVLTSVHLLLFRDWHSDAQMIDPDAERLLGTRADGNTFIRSSIGKFPRATMCSHLLSVDLESAGPTQWVRAPQPQMMFTTAVYVLFKSRCVAHLVHVGECIDAVYRDTYRWCIAPIWQNASVRYTRKCHGLGT